MELVTVMEQYKAFLESGDKPKSDRTVEAYVGSVRRILTPVSTLWFITDIMQAYLNAWRNTLTASKRAGNVSDSKIRIEVAALRGFYNFALENNYITVNPMMGIKSIARDRRLPRPMPVPDVQKLLAVASTKIGESSVIEWRNRAMLECFIHGLRNVEVARLNIEKIRYDATEGSLVLRVMGKGMYERDVVLNKNSASFLAVYLLQRFDRPVEGLSVLELFDRVDFLITVMRGPAFVKNVSDRLTRQDINTIFRLYRGAAKLDKSYGPHSLRHTCGTQLLSKGWDIRTVQDWLGHRNIEQTVLYTQVLLSDKAEAAMSLPTAGGAID